MSSHTSLPVRVVLACLFLLSAAACGDEAGSGDPATAPREASAAAPAGPEGVVGVWHLDASTVPLRGNRSPPKTSSRRELTLREDGSFSLMTTVPGRDVAALSGTWTWVQDEAAAVLTFPSYADGPVGKPLVRRAYLVDGTLRMRSRVERVEREMVWTREPPQAE